MPFLTAQEYANHLPVRSESHLILQHSEQTRSSYNEQRMLTQSSVTYSSPSLSRAHFSGISGVDLENRRDSLHCNVGSVDMAPVSLQHSSDNVAALKSESYHHSHLRQLSALAGTKDPVILQRKLEELRPIFQQLQQQAAQAQLAVPTTANGTDQPHSPSRSPVGTRPKGPNPTELHSAFDISSVRSNLHLNVVSSAALSNDSSTVNCVSSRVSKVCEEQKGTSVVSGVRKSSPGVASTVPFNQYASSLPLPKRLTESVQKLVKPLPLDNSLPHQKSRSPSSSASTVKQGSISTVSLPKTNARGVASGTSKTPVVDTSHLDIDSITPSITGFCFDGPLDLANSLPHLSSTSLNEELATPSLQTTDSSVSAGTLISSVSQASTVLVPAVTSSILSHKTHSSESATSSAFPSSNVLPGGGSITNPVSVSSANVPTTTLCNSDTKMANFSVKERTVKASINSTGLSPPILHPYNARYPVLKHEDKPKSPYQQMGLSEMLQETANLHSISAERLPPQNTSCTRRNSSCGQLNITDSNQEIHNSSNEISDLPIPVLSRQNSNISDLKLVNFDPSASISEVIGSSVASDLLSVPNTLSLKTCINTNTTSTVNQPVPNINSNTQTSVSVKDAVNNRCEMSPVVGVNLEPGFQASAQNRFLSLDLKILENEKSETSQSVEGQLTKDCDNVKQDKTDCDKVVVVPASMSSANTDTSCATKPTPISQNSNVSLPVDNIVRSTTPENLEYGEVSKSIKTKPRSQTSPEESQEDKSASSISQASSEFDLAPRQLRSRKRTNTGESDSSNPSEEPNKKTRLDGNTETSSKNDSSKLTSSLKINSSPTVLSGNELKNLDDPNTQTLIDTVKSGLRARTNVKNVHPMEEKEKEREKAKTVTRETRKDGKTIGKTVPEKKVDVPKPEEVRRNSQSRRSRQSPNLQEKPQNTAGMYYC